MSSSSPWDSYGQNSGLPSSIEQYGHSFSTEMRNLSTAQAASGMTGLSGEGMLGYPKSSELSGSGNLNSLSAYNAYSQSAYTGVSELGFPGSAAMRPGSATHSPAAAENLTASSPQGQFSGTPTSENQSASPSFSNSTSLYTPSTLANSIASSPYPPPFGSSTVPAAESAMRGTPFSPFAQSYGYPMYGYNQMGGFPPSANSLEGVNRYMGGISSAQLMQSSAMGLYSNAQPGQMPFPYPPSMGWGPGIPGLPSFKQNPDIMSHEDIERYRYRQLSNPYFPGIPPGAHPGQGFPPHPLQPGGMMRSPGFLDDRAGSPAPKKQKKASEESERAPTPSPRDPAAFHSQRGIYLFSTGSEPGNREYHADNYVLLEKDLCEKLARVSLPGKIQYVYNPLEYAFDSHLKFVRRFCSGEKYILFVGMNPGPFGMSQNGVPFGECAMVKEWLQIEGEVLKPVLEHPKRRVVGLECSRSEVTGGRFWQLFKTLCHTPEQFFRTSFVHNLCPFAFLTDAGKNVTPPQLTSSVLDQINNLCNATLVEVVRLLKCKYVICIGKYALAQAQKALSADEFSSLTLECLMHPSPINPAANKGWADIAIKQLTEIGIIDVIRYGTVPFQANSSSNTVTHQSTVNHQPQQLSSNHQYNSKQSPSHYGFQSPPVQTYHQSPAPLQGSNSNHQSPAHGPPRNQSPAQARSQASPAHAAPSRNSQSSPGHSSCSQSPAQRGPSQSPGQNMNSIPTAHPDKTTPDPIQDNFLGPEPIGENANSQDSTKTCSASKDKGQDGTNIPQLPSNGVTQFTGQINAAQSQENGGNSQSDLGSQDSDASKVNSPTVGSYSASVNSNTPDSQNSHVNQTMPGQIGLPNASMRMAMSGPRMPIHSIPQMGSPSLQQSTTVEHPTGNMSGQVVGSPHVNSQNSHMGTINPHMASHMSSISGQMGMNVGHGGQIPFNQHLEMSSMSGYGSGITMNNYQGQPSRPPSDVIGYGSYPGMNISSMGSIHSSVPQQMGMYPAMNSMIAGQEQHQQYGMNSMYSPMEKEMTYQGQYVDKPPECS